MMVSRVLFHLGGRLFYIYGTYHDSYIVTEDRMLYGGRFKYLTFLNLVRDIKAACSTKISVKLPTC